MAPAALPAARPLAAGPARQRLRIAAVGLALAWAAILIPLAVGALRHG
ncbi:MAG TPA: hypothetical protein VFF98_17300 [Novosphingobium sp.]|nr:hypothetical protein [Novosphingobium sp.]HZV08603.1 hypothetical protein [Novosphingobium sp.]